MDHASDVSSTHATWIEREPVGFETNDQVETQQVHNKHKDLTSRYELLSACPNVRWKASSVPSGLQELVFWTDG